MASAVAWLQLAIALVGTAVGQVLYKLYAERRSGPLLALAAGALVLGPVFSYLALRVLSIGQVYMSAAATQVIVLALSRALLRETITRQQLAASVVIVVGVVLYAS